MIDDQQNGGQRSETEAHAVTGKILSVGAASFIVEVTRNRETSSLEFVTDTNTRIEGKLTVGAQVSVEYRPDRDKNLAVHVVVSPLQ